ncbi:TPR repeat family protein [Babesia bovis T2Bo]|nr:TPR repeat family protein [Babesia bovis T2Bo]EDO05816.2 TPR repeat family protein [Babesia bovis T2Bo]
MMDVSDVSLDSVGADLPPLEQEDKGVVGPLDAGSDPGGDREDVIQDDSCQLFGRNSPAFLKERGNVAFKEGDIFRARELYTSAIVRLEYADNISLKSQLFANRAACNLAFEDYDAALEDSYGCLLSLFF